jgi:predicted RNase H-like HicB family nuclease
MSIQLSTSDRQYLERIAGTPPTERQKAIALLRLAEGMPLERVAESAWITKNDVAQLVERFAKEGLAGIGLGAKADAPAESGPAARQQIIVLVHEVEGGGCWAEVPSMPGCILQAETMEALQANVAQAIADWSGETPEKTEAEAKQLASIQGSSEPADKSFPVPYDYSAPPSWTDEDE